MSFICCDTSLQTLGEAIDDGRKLFDSSVLAHDQMWWQRYGSPQTQAWGFVPPQEGQYPSQWQPPQIPFPKSSPGITPLAEVTRRLVIFPKMCSHQKMLKCLNSSDQEGRQQIIKNPSLRAVLLNTENIWRNQLKFVFINKLKITILGLVVQNSIESSSSMKGSTGWYKTNRQLFTTTTNRLRARHIPKWRQFFGNYTWRKWKFGIRKCLLVANREQFGRANLIIWRR